MNMKIIKKETISFKEKNAKRFKIKMRKKY